MSAVATDIARIPAGLGDAVHHGQAVFRCVLEAMARPGRLQRLPADVAGALGHPPGWSPALAATLLTLLDAETALWLSPALRDGVAPAWLRFHTGTRIVDAPGAADFAAARADEVDASIWTVLKPGSDEAPHTGATLLLQVDCLSDAAGLRLQGPGIEHEHRLDAAGLDSAFWQARIAQQADFPCGVDLLLCCDDRVAGLPRSTRVTEG
ncbi:phosphonate C-P lyase system protein PhnH [Pseudothauera rhizosphaerae]|uniref:Phosphonate C-P lyase system protein PhnH n=1 Tax=Pseudothauera rhizosphaerae TaxID=2565932 RepID=A0A4S4AK08_9RHOO|nr:phosphonate C-P lyase system protein PhnH [Pseudothauera rhizosphaerae]THF59243.1 phosphonate C-P lyase system protein PhnH [Pseudothauera rhizosphaerae]